MKIDLCLMLEATVICTLAVFVVVPTVDGNISKAGGLTEPPRAGVDKAKTDNNAKLHGEQRLQPSSPTSKLNSTISPVVTSSPRPITKDTNCTTVNGTECVQDNSFGAMLSKNKGMLQRAVYVLVAVTVVILVYFGLRTWSTRKRRSKTKKYGLITTPASDLEMTPLDQEDDDEDMTVFEVNGLHK